MAGRDGAWCGDAAAVAAGGGRWPPAAAHEFSSNQWRCAPSMPDGVGIAAHYKVTTAAERRAGKFTPSAALRSNPYVAR